MTSDTLLLIDGHSLAFRAFFSFPPNLTHNGAPINAVYGFATLLMGVIDRCCPTHVAVCFDRKEPTFRHRVYDQYKGHRPPAPEEFVAQLPLLTDVISALGIRSIDFAGYEADDLLGTLSLSAELAGMQALILTGDRDAFQLVSDRVHVLMNRKGVSELDVFDPAAIHAKYGLVPHQLIDLKALQGDSSDNIPGVRGIGEKSATALMHQYGSLAAIFEQLDDIKPDRVRHALAQGRGDAELSRTLAEIDRHVPVDCPLDTLQFVPDWRAIVSCFERYEFKTLKSKYGKYLVDHDQSVASTPMANITQPPLTSTEIISSVGQFDALVPEMMAGFSVDLETTSLSVHDAQIVGVAISYRSGHAVYLPLNDWVVSETNQLDLFGGGGSADGRFNLSPLLSRLKPLLENRSVPKWTHNGKYEIEVLANYGIHLVGIADDSMLAGFMLAPNERIGLKEMVSRWFNVTMTPFDALVGSGKSKRSLVDIPPEAVGAYAGADADYTRQLITTLRPFLQDSTALMLYRDIELPLQAVLADMERTGVRIDRPYLATLSRDYRFRLQALETSIHDLAGRPFNISSPKQLGQVLFDDLQLPEGRATKTGRSTDSEVLDGLVDHHPIAGLLLSYRKLEKLLNTYVDALPGLIHPRTGNVHTSFNQTGAVTGRMSSTNPNLQNIPIRDPDGLAIRRAFIPSAPNGRIVSADYSQIELRLMAYLSGDEAMLDAFRRDMDIHRSTASILFGVPESQVSKEQRYQAKAVNFGIIYGISSFGLARNIGVSRSDAKRIIDGYFQSFPKVKEFMDQTIVDARRDGCVWTEFGRVRPLPELSDRLPARRQFAERTAINTRLQGTAADLIKLAMVNIYRTMQENQFRSKMTIQVHDELVFDCVESEVDSIAQLVKAEMETAWTISIPLRADVSIGLNWEDA